MQYRIVQERLERFLASRALSRFVSASLLAVSIVGIGCAGSSQVVLVPDPPPVLSDMGLIQFDAMSANGCLATGDPIAEYLHETEDYFDYIDTLRGEEPVVPDSPWWRFWD